MKVPKSLRRLIGKEVTVSFSMTFEDGGETYTKAVFGRLIAADRDGILMASSEGSIWFNLYDVHSIQEGNHLDLMHLEVPKTDGD